MTSSMQMMVATGVTVVATAEGTAAEMEEVMVAAAAAVTRVAMVEMSAVVAVKEEMSVEATVGEKFRPHPHHHRLPPHFD